MSTWPGFAQGSKTAPPEITIIASNSADLIVGLQFQDRQAESNPKNDNHIYCLFNLLFYSGEQAHKQALLDFIEKFAELNYYERSHNESASTKIVLQSQQVCYISLDEQVDFLKQQLRAKPSKPKIHAKYQRFLIKGALVTVFSKRFRPLSEMNFHELCQLFSAITKVHLRVINLQNTVLFDFYSTELEQSEINVFVEVAQSRVYRFIKQNNDYAKQKKKLIASGDRNKKVSQPPLKLSENIKQSGTPQIYLNKPSDPPANRPYNYQVPQFSQQASDHAQIESPVFVFNSTESKVMKANNTLSTPPLRKSKSKKMSKEVTNCLMKIMGMVKETDDYKMRMEKSVVDIVENLSMGLKNSLYKLHGNSSNLPTQQQIGQQIQSLTTSLFMNSSLVEILTMNIKGDFLVSVNSNINKQQQSSSKGQSSPNLFGALLGIANQNEPKKQASPMNLNMITENQQGQSILQQPEDETAKNIQESPEADPQQSVYCNNSYCEQSQVLKKAQSQQDSSKSDDQDDCEEQSVIVREKSEIIYNATESQQSFLENQAESHAEHFQLAQKIDKDKIITGPTEFSKSDPNQDFNLALMVNDFKKFTQSNNNSTGRTTESNPDLNFNNIFSIKSDTQATKLRSGMLVSQETEPAVTKAEKNITNNQQAFSSYIENSGEISVIEAVENLNCKEEDDEIIKNALTPSIMQAKKPGDINYFLKLINYNQQNKEIQREAEDQSSQSSDQKAYKQGPDRLPEDLKQRFKFEKFPEIKDEHLLSVPQQILLKKADLQKSDKLGRNMIKQTDKSGVIQKPGKKISQLNMSGQLNLSSSFIDASFKRSIIADNSLGESNYYSSKN